MDKVFIVTSSHGEYDDYVCIDLRAFLDQNDAQTFQTLCELCQLEYKEFQDNQRKELEGKSFDERRAIVEARIGKRDEIVKSIRDKLELPDYWPGENDSFEIFELELR